MNDVSSRLTFGIFDHLDASDADLAQQYKDRLSLVEMYDRLGFYAYHLAEHHFTPHGRAPSPNLFLSSVAQRTKRLRLGPLVMLLNSYHPLRAFEEICMLDHLSDGRLELGIGRGAFPVELGFFGVDAGAAQDRYVEAGEIVLNAMKGGRLSHRGHHFELDDIPLLLGPYQRPHPPMWLVTTRPERTAWAAAIGSNLASLGSASSVRRITDAFRAYREEVGDRVGRQPLLGMLRMVVIASSEASAHSLAASAYERWLDSFKFLYDLKKVSLPSNLPPDIDAAIENELCVVGTAAAVRRTLLDQAKQAGINYLLCQVAFGDLPLDASLYTAMAIHREIMRGDFCEDAKVCRD